MAGRVILNGHRPGCYIGWPMLKLKTLRECGMKDYEDMKLMGFSS
jgi:hypothetical protein